MKTKKPINISLALLLIVLLPLTLPSYAAAAQSALKPPASVKAVSASYNSVKVSWSAVSGATKYEVVRASAKTGTYKLLAATTSLSYVNMGVNTGAVYYYKVRAYRLAGGKKTYGAFSAVASAKAVPSAPAGAKAAGDSATSAVVSWRAVAGATQYEVWKCTTSATGVFTQLPATASLSYTDTGLTLGSAYWYKVRAGRLAGGAKVYGGFSATVRAKPHAKLYGLDFSPYIGAGQSPDNGTYITESQLRRTLAEIAPYTQWIRTYGCTGCMADAGSIAHELKLKVAAGAWIGTDLAANEAEIAALIQMAKNKEADVLIVGSEALRRGDITEAQLTSYIDRVKEEANGIPVTTAETYDMFLNHPSLIGHIDCVYANIYPYWEGVAIDDAIQRLDGSYQALKSLAGVKEVVLSETGWPDGGNARDAAVPSPENASLYFSKFLSWASLNAVSYFYFEAFDEPWKADNGIPQEAHWGVWNSGETIKPLMEQVLCAPIP